MTHGNRKAFFKRIFLRLHLLSVARSLHRRFRRATDHSFRAKDDLLGEEFRRFSVTYGAVFRQLRVAEQNQGKRVLIVNAGSLGLLVEIALVKAFELAGYHPVLLMDYDREVLAYYRAVGVHDIHDWTEIARSINQSDVARIFEPVRSFEQLLNVEYRGVRVGKYAASTALRSLRVGRLDLGDQATRDAVLPFLHRSMAYAQAAQDLLEVVHPQLVLSMDLGYSPRGELFDLCQAAGIGTITWNAAHKNNQLMLKRYSRANSDVHPASLSAETWDALQTRPWTESDRERLRRELMGSYMSGEWYGEVGTQFHTTLQQEAEIREALNLADGKKTAVIFSHIFWDGTFFYGADLFGSYEEWFIETMKAACANSHVNWIVKIHPANIVKNVRDGVASEPSELTAIRSLGKTLPAHVRVVQSDSRISTFSLYSVMDYCVTVRGTVGIEAASFGIPVITAGTGRYDRRGFTLDSDSRAEYLNRLAYIHEIPSLSTAQRELAERYAYGVFVLRPFSLHTVSLEFQRDAKASLHTRVCLPNDKDLRAATDLRALAGWINSGEEDFLSSSLESPRQARSAIIP